MSAYSQGIEAIPHADSSRAAEQQSTFPTPCLMDEDLPDPFQRRASKGQLTTSPSWESPGPPPAPFTVKSASGMPTLHARVPTTVPFPCKLSSSRPIARTHMAPLTAPELQGGAQRQGPARPRGTRKCGS